MHDKKKPAMALVISVGPKMPKKPTDTATPDKMKKYGSMKKAWGVLKENMEVSDSPEFNLCKNCGGKGKLSHTSSIYSNSKGADVYGEGGQMCDDCEGTGYMQQNNPAFAAMQQKLTGEPMDLAFRLLKEGLAGMDGLDPDGNYPDDPRMQNTGINAKKLIEMRAARDAARAQMGQANPNRGGDIDPN